MTHPREDRTAAPTSRLVRPYVEPIQLRLVGRDLAVVTALDILREVFSLSDISQLVPARGGNVRLYATLTRRYPYSGGIK
ncbi:hypothetical protein AB0M47_38880 [Hamadaea sp. NPDC051192]|uniref:hypothetical protein n=1 Tax=Hamadaea sp. NPDC051192 TaxID=3154940 RepID=UPI0034277421